MGLPGLAVRAVLEVELDRARPSGLGVGQHVVVGEQDVRRDQRSGPVADDPAAGVADVDAAHRMRGDDAGLEVVDADEVRGADDPLEHLAGGLERCSRGRCPPGHAAVERGGEHVLHRGARSLLAQRRPRRPSPVAAQPVEPRRDAAGLVCEADAPRLLERVDAPRPVTRSLRDARRRRVLLGRGQLLLPGSLQNTQGVPN